MTHDFKVKNGIIANNQVVAEQFRATNKGTAANTAYSFTGDDNTGIISPSADTIQIVVGGSAALTSNTSITRGTFSGDDISTGTVADARLPSTAVRTSRSITTGNGLTGGGNLTSNRTLSVVAGNAIVANATGVHVIGGNGISVNSTAVGVTAGNGLTANATGVHVVAGNAISVNATSIGVVAGNGLTVDSSAVSLGTPASITVSTTNTVGSINHTHNLDLSGRSITAGNGLSGGGNLSANRSFAVVPGNGLGVNSTAVFMQTPSVITTSTVDGTNSTSHTHSLDLSGRSIIAGSGLTGGGNLGTDRTIAVSPGDGLGVNSTAVFMQTPATITVSTTNVANTTTHTHAIDLSGRSITAGNGLSGGGTLAANRTIAVVPGNGLGVNSTAVFALGGNGIAVNSTSITAVGGNGLNVTSSGIHAVAGSGISVNSTAIGVNAGNGMVANSTGVHAVGGNAITVNSTAIGVTAGNGIGVNAGGVFLETPASITTTTTNSVGATNHTHALDLSGRSISTGNGLTGGGNLSANRTLSVTAGNGLTANATGVHAIAGDGISINSTAIGVDSTVVRTTGNQTIAGVKTYSDNVIFNGNIGLGRTPIVSLDVGGKTDAFAMPNGTTEQRPIGAPGMLRFNSTTGEFEGYANTTNGWSQLALAGSAVDADFLGSNPPSYYLDATNLTGVIPNGNLPTDIVRTSRTLTAGNGLSGGGNLTANRTFTLGTPSTITVSSTNNVGTATHEHAIDLSGRTITAGNGLSGGGNLGSDLTFAVGAGDGVSVNATAVAVDSTVARTTTSVSAGNGLSGGGTLASNRTLNVVAGNGLNVNSTAVFAVAGDGIAVNSSAIGVDSSVARSAVNFSAGDGLSGGGTLAANRSFAVDGTVVRTTRSISTGDGLSGGGDLTANRTLAVDGTVVRTSRAITAGNGLSGGGDFTANRSFAVGAGDGISVNATAVSVDSTVVRTTQTVSAGNGLSGGGALTGNVSLAVGAGSGISVNSTAVGVDSTVVRTSGNQSLTGTKTFTTPPVIDSTTAVGLQVSRNNAATNSVIQATTTGGSAYFGVGDSGWFNIGSTADIRWANDGVFRLRMSDGYLGVLGEFVAGGNITAFSDRKLKDNIATFENALETVSKLRGVRYTRKDTGKGGIGVIAQEIQEVLPELVTDNDGTLSVAYGNIVGVLIEAIKDLDKQVKELKGEK